MESEFYLTAIIVEQPQYFSTQRMSSFWGFIIRIHDCLKSIGRLSFKIMTFLCFIGILFMILRTFTEAGVVHSNIDVNQTGISDTNFESKSPPSVETTTTRSTIKNTSTPIEIWNPEPNQKRI